MEKVLKWLDGEDVVICFRQDGCAYMPIFAALATMLSKLRQLRKTSGEENPSTALQVFDEEGAVTVVVKNGARYDDLIMQTLEQVEPKPLAAFEATAPEPLTKPVPPAAIANDVPSVNEHPRFPAGFGILGVDLSDMSPADVVDQYGKRSFKILSGAMRDPRLAGQKALLRDTDITAQTYAHHSFGNIKDPIGYAKRLDQVHRCDLIATFGIFASEDLFAFDGAPKNLQKEILAGKIDKLDDKVILTTAERLLQFLSGHTTDRKGS